AFATVMQRSRLGAALSPEGVLRRHPEGSDSVTGRVARSGGWGPVPRRRGGIARGGAPPLPSVSRMVHFGPSTARSPAPRGRRLWVDDKGRRMNAATVTFLLIGGIGLVLLVVSLFLGDLDADADGPFSLPSVAGFVGAFG